MSKPRLTFTDQDAHQALAMGFLALHDAMIEAGTLPEGMASEMLRRFKARDDRPGLALLVKHLADEMDAGSFRPGATPIRGVIDGGKQ
jgi:hypothetical protein